jgi:amino acid adenylation domain-containing protein
MSATLRDALRDQKKEVVAALQDERSHQTITRPLAANQRGLWFLHQLVPTSFAYNLAFTIRIRGGANFQVLEETLQVLMDRHESLRTNYPLSDGIPKRQVLGYLRVPFELIDARKMNGPQLRARIQADHARPFDLKTGPIFRATLYEEGNGDHLLLLDTHHIAADGTALFVLLQEMFAIYDALLNKSAMPAGEAQATFQEFVEWQEKTLANSDSDYAYWAEVLSPVPPPLEIPTDHGRAHEFAMRGGSVHKVLRAPLASAVHTLAKNESTTDYVVLLSLWFVLLSRLSGHDDVTVGTPVLGRPSARFARTVGDLVNMLPLRIRSLHALTFSQLVQQVRKVVLCGMAHQDVPLPHMLERIDHRRSEGRPPFQSLFILQNFSHFQDFERLLLGEEGERFAFGPLTVSPYRIDQQEGQFEIALDIWQQDSEYLCTCRYDSDLHDAGTISRWVGHYETLMRAAVSAPRMPVSLLPLIDPEERRALVENFNRTAVDYPREKTVVDLFTAQAARRPAAAAVRHNGVTLTYGQLANRSDQFARHLLALGVQPDSLIGLCLERSAELLVAILGILKAGAAYVPLDPGFPRERLTYMLEDCAAPLLVTASALRPRLFPETRVTVVNVDGDAQMIARASSAPFSVLARPENRAYVLYTSGSTGRPKGVEIEHRALTNFLTSLAREPGLDQNDILLAITTLSFDIAGLELLLPLVTGARIELAGRETALDGVALARLLEESKATIMQATPVTWRMLFESGWRGSAGLKALCGGEAMGRDLAAQLLPVCRELWNLYGPTETTIWSSTARVLSADDISIGRPIANTQMYVLDGHREPVPVGVVGELWIGGAGLARGYCNRADLTAERFVDNPFHPGRMYRTGDLARCRGDGRIDCLGRADAQVKIRGFRIELGEIEAVLGEHPAVAECAVVARELAGELRLIAYVVGSASPEDGRRHLRNRVPEYMVPTVFVALSVLPKTLNHKIDRNALPPPDTSAIASAREYVPPVSETEKIVAQIFGEILGLPAVGATDNFFELGGHSLLATRVMARLHQHFGIELPLRALFEHPTTAGIGAYLDVVLWTREQASRTSHSKESDDRITIDI